MDMSTISLSIVFPSLMVETMETLIYSIIILDPNFYEMLPTCKTILNYTLQFQNDKEFKMPIINHGPPSNIVSS